LKKRDITSLGVTDQDRVSSPLLLVIGLELGAEPSGFDAHNGVDPRVVGLVSIKDLQAEPVLLDLIPPTLECLFNGIA
jgi:hypothetical protein